MKDLFKFLTKKITGITDSNDAHRIRVIINRMESLVKTSSSEDIKITEWNKNSSNYQENKEQWAYEPQRKTIFYPVEGDFAVTKLRDEHIISILLHEISHSKFTERPDISFPEPRYAFVQMINAFEDVRVEKKLMLEYPGTYDSLKNFSDIIEKSVGKEHWTEKPDYINYLLNVLRTEWDRKQVVKNEKVAEALKNTEQAIKKATEAESTSEMIDDVLLPEVWGHLKKLIQAPPQQQNNKPQQNNAGGSKDNKQNKEQDKQEKKEEGGNKDKEEKPEENFKGVSNIKDEIEKAVSKEYLPQQSSPNINIKQKPDDEEKERKKAKSDIKVSRHYNSYKKTYEELYIEIEPYIHYFAKKLNSIMVDNQLKRKGGAFKTGKLNNKKLYKWKCKSNRLFAKDIFRLHKAYSVTLLIDESGSMSENNIENASLSAVLLAEVLDFVDIPFEVVGFNETVRVYKKINEPFTWNKKRNMENIIPAPNSEGRGNTNDAYAINRAVNRLKYRTGEKIIIVLTDGSTNPSGGLIPAKDKEGIPLSKKYLYDLDLREEIHFAQNKNIIIGIGINTDYIKYIYPQHTSINQISELPRLVLNQLKKQIRRG